MNQSFVLPPCFFLVTKLCLVMRLLEALVRVDTRVLAAAEAELRESAFPSREAVNLLNDRVFSCRKSLFLVERSTIR
jgi:hypothetical protein